MRSPPFPQVQFPLEYMRFRAHLLSRRYSSLWSTCGFALTSFPAGTVPTGVRANSPSPPFPQVRFPWMYMRVCTHPLLRTYNSRRSTCVFALIPFYARTIPAGVHAVLHSPPSPHVQFPQEYMRFLLHLLFHRHWDQVQPPTLSNKNKYQKGMPM